MRIYIKDADIKYKNPYPDYDGKRIERAMYSLNKAKSYLKEKRYEEALKALPYGVEIIIDGTLYYEYEGDYGFIGTIKYYKGNGHLYPGDTNSYMINFLKNAQKSIILQFVDCGYKREPMFT